MNKKYSICTTWRREASKENICDMCVLYVLFNDNTYKRYIFMDNEYYDMLKDYKEKFNLHRQVGIETIINSGQITQRKMDEKQIENYINKQLTKLKERSKL